LSLSDQADALASFFAIAIAVGAFVKAVIDTVAGRLTPMVVALFLIGLAVVLRWIGE
jgi:hypothetical protein